MTTHELLADLRHQGFQLTPLPGDRLEVRPLSKVPEELRAELKRGKREGLTLLTHQHASPWLCAQCGSPAVVAEGEPSLAGARRLTVWQCEAGQTGGVPPSPLREPPVWVSRKAQGGMMNLKATGTRNEHRSSALLEQAGYKGPKAVARPARLLALPFWPQPHGGP